MTFAAAFKYTFPITKSEQRADGRYIIGYASGPEVDLEGERMAPEAISRFADQINSSDPEMELVYRDAHAPDGVLRDLGVIKKAWINEHMHLGVEVRLDDDNPASEYLWKQVTVKKKQYGMSVSGRVLDYADEFVAEVGKTVRTYKNVVLDEISNTTRPAWYPSFGSVLSKSIKDASVDASDGASTMKVGPNGELLDENVEDTTAKSADETTDETDKSAEDVSVDAASTDDTDKSQDEAESSDEDVDKSDDESTDEDVDKAGRNISAANGRKLLSLYNEMTVTLTDLGLIEVAVEGSEKSDSTDEEDTLDKSAESTEDDGLAALQAQVEALTKANTEQAAKIEELMKAPRTPVPAAITDETKKSAELGDILAKATPSERLRLAMALQTQGK